MISKYVHLKEKAIDLRSKGISLVKIEKKLSIPRSTLSGWFKNINLSDEQRDLLKKSSIDNLKIARVKAVVWHNEQKANRVDQARMSAESLLKSISMNDSNILELTLALLYLGEGFKGGCTGIGNSDPMVLKFFISILINVYKVEINKIKCELHLRADQNIDVEKKFWSIKLEIPLENFNSVSFDKRTIGKKTFQNYHGVCIVRCGKIAIQRKLIYLSKIFCNAVINNRAISSVGRAQH